jgi:hypothetical protein
VQCRPRRRGAGLELRLTPHLTPLRAQHAETVGNRQQGNRYRYADSATPRNRCRRIVAPKGAGSSPVGHPSTFRTGMRDKRNWGCLSGSDWGAFDATAGRPTRSLGSMTPLAGEAEEDIVMGGALGKSVSGRGPDTGYKSSLEKDPRNHADFIWSVAEHLRGDDKQSEYGKVILPLTVLRWLAEVLVSTKQQVLERMSSCRAGSK